MGILMVKLPPQLLPFNKKNKKWRKLVVDWADSKSFYNYSPVRKSVIHKKINYDLVNGKLHMDDLQLIVNPSSITAGYIPDNIQHYPIINSKLRVLIGEESKRIFDFKVVVTNPNAISEIENTKKKELLQRLLEWVSNTALSEEEANEELEKINLYYSYEWLDLREIRANSLINHYIKEYNMPLLFNNGFMDAMVVGEEIYLCDIVGGEPVIKKLDPLKVRVFKSGFSNKIEDADVIILEDYWSPSQIIDTYHEVLSKKDIEYIENLPNTTEEDTDSMDNIDPRKGFVNGHMLDETFDSEYLFDPFNLYGGLSNSLLPYDNNGNIRVLQVYWKSRRKIKKVKSYNETGEEVYNFYPENYVLNEDLGEEEEIFYINEAWEGTKIGKDIYVNMRPRIILYNRLSNPSRCHFGIVGSIYNINDSKPYSLVDMMKPYNYLYDVIHDRLNKLIARSWGSILRLDFAKKPKGWDVEKWVYYAKTMGLAVEDSFKEGDYGAALGKLSGGLNNASTGVIAASDSNQILQYTNLLEYIKLEMSEVAGITRLREGQVSNRETVGGVERSMVQSSHITEWLFVVHEDVKRRALECFLETAKIALKGRSKKFSYILSDNSQRVMNIDGDEFAEADYGLVVDSSNGMLELQQKLNMLALAALQNQTLSFSTVMKLYNSCSLAEKQRLVEKDEQAIQQRLAEALLQQTLLLQLLMEQLAQIELAKMQQEDTLNSRDNETKLLIAQIQAASNNAEPLYTQEALAKLQESMRQFDARLELDKERLLLDKEIADKNATLKEKLLNSKSTKQV